MDGKCSGDRCAPLKRQTDAQAIACTKSQQSGQDIGDQCEYIQELLLDFINPNADGHIPGLPSLPGMAM